MHPLMPARRLSRAALTPFVLTLALFGLSLTTARAATLAVTNTSDSGLGSLRAAIATANADGGNGAPDTIKFALPAGSVITVASTLNISAPMTIQGPGAANLAIDGGHTTGITGVEIFSINSGTVGRPVTLSGLTIQNGHTNDFGGGVNINYNSVAVLNGCTFTGNNATGNVSDSGGAINNNGTLTVTGCTFTGNSASRGGGINNNSKATVTGCTLAGNTGGQFGSGGINNNGALTVTGCLITGNSTTDSIGGGVNNFGTATLTGCTIVGNSAQRGGGVYNGVTLTMTGCTLTGNSATIANGGGGFYNGSGTATLTDNIVYNNETGGEIAHGSTGTLTVAYCDVQGGYAGTGNINADPQFVSSTDLHLKPTSPCIGAGISVPGGTFDIAGVPRFAPPSIGAYEYYSGTATVTNTNASGNGSLAAAVTYADSHPYTVILFDPTAFAAPKTITPGATLTITAPTAILGPAAGVAIDGNNAYRVFEVTAGGLSGIGLTVQHGDTSAGANASAGGGSGLRVDSGASLSLTGCAVSGNSSAGNGGGLFCAGTATLTGCAVSGNSTPNGGAYHGGGLFNSGTMALAGCAVTGNSNDLGSGLASSGALTLTGCAICGNSNSGTIGFGGGVFNYGTATLTGCTLSGNSATNSGGGLYNSGTATLADDIFYGDGGGEISGTVTASHCDIGQNGGYTDGGGNINADPLFVNAPGDLHLQSGSPCAGTGTATAPSYLPYDLDGRPRPTPPNSAPSIGAYEAAPTGAYSLVVTNTSDSLPQSLRAAVQCADDYPDAAITFDPVNFSTFQTITLTKGQLTLSQPMTITGPAPGVAVDGSHSSRIFEISGGTSTDPVTLTGLTIQNGKVTTANGGGVLVDQGCVVLLTSCTLTGCSTNNVQGGGGLYNQSGTLTLTACTLVGNSSGNGGGLDNVGGTATLTGCFLAGNSGYFGGGLYNDIGKATLTACTLVGNSGGFGGGALYNSDTLALTGCTLTGNSAGGLFNDGMATLTDDILYGDIGTEVFNAGIPAGATYCDIQGGYAGTGNINVDPQFVTPPVVDFRTTPPTSSNGFGDPHVKPGSPVVGAGIQQSSNLTDFDGKTRANPPTIGAYEGAAATTGTTVTSSANPSVYGQSVTFTATVANTSGGSAVPNGSVVFTIDNVAQPSVTLTTVGGKQVATFTTSTLSINGSPHSVSAAYTPAGNNFVGSTGSLANGQTVTAGTVAKLVVSTTTTMTTAGTAFSVTVTAQDSGGNTVTGYKGTVHFTSSDGQALLPANYTFTSTDAGTHTFSVTLKTAGNKTVTATDTVSNSVTGTTGNILVSAGAAAKLAVSAPGAATAGHAFGATVTAQDAFGNPASSTATVSFTSTDPRAVLPAPVALSNGTATVNITYYTAGQQTLTAAATSLTSGTALTTVSSDPAGTPSVAVSNVVLTRTNSTTVTVAFSLVNTGVGQANSVTVTVAKLGTVSANSLPAAATIGAGQSASYSLTFTGVAAGANTLTLNGAYTNAAATTSYAFSGGKKVTVP